MQWTQARMKEVAHEEREDLGVGPVERLDPYALAEVHGIPVYTLEDLRDWDLGEEALFHFSNDATGQWSAALLPIGPGRVIIENAAHAPVRRRTNIAHELGHFLLEHEFDAVHLLDPVVGGRDSKKEKEADFLGAELLIPERAAIRAAFLGQSDREVATEFDVSAKYARWRMSGPRVIAKRSKRAGTRR